MSLFAADLYFTIRHGMAAPDGALLNVTNFLRQSFGQHVLCDLLGLAICGGIYIVPLYALLQLKADPEHGGRAIASNNLVNALFMVASAAFAIGCIALGLTLPQIFLAAAILNVFAALYMRRLRH
jgi:acyl-[acyl-carrier-protein]-phospholipid O-acyltransferase/long-chain-fatty-acid--[acyl-carrier-protein] ligase